MIAIKPFNDETEVNQLKIEECEENELSESFKQDLLHFCKENSYGCLAAPQLGIHKKFFVMEGQIYVNPSIEELSEKSIKISEFCENFQDKRIESYRYAWVKISYLENGEYVTKKFTEHLAQYVQFCMDWLESTLGVVSEAIVQKPVKNETTVNRNDPCPCGSGKKYKKCCSNK